MMDENFRKRIRRRLYYGDLTGVGSPSLPLTELTVEYFKDSVSQKLGHVDLDIASNLVKRNNVSPCSMVLSMLYAKRLRQRNKDYLGSISSTDVFFISMMMASKYLYDEGVEEEVFNDEWAENSEQEVDEINQMEIDFLQAMDWRLFVRPEEFETTLTNVERRLALREGLQRGWFTYSELAVLADMNLITNLWNNVGLDCTKLAAVVSAAYLAGLMSMVGSAVIAAQVSGPLSSAVVAIISTQLVPTALIHNQEALPHHELSAFNFGAAVLSDHTSVNAFLYNQPIKENETDQELSKSENYHDNSISGSLVTKPEISIVLDQMYGACCEEKRADDALLTSVSKGKSPLLSLLFLDSLLSQLWSVTYWKSKYQRWCEENKSVCKRKGKTRNLNQYESLTRRKRNTCSQQDCPKFGLPSSFGEREKCSFVHFGLSTIPSVSKPVQSSSLQNYDESICMLYSPQEIITPPCLVSSLYNHHESLRNCCCCMKSDQKESAEFASRCKFFSLAMNNFHQTAMQWTDNSIINRNKDNTYEYRHASSSLESTFLLEPFVFGTGLPHLVKVT